MRPNIDCKAKLKAYDDEIDEGALIESFERDEWLSEPLEATDIYGLRKLALEALHKNQHFNAHSEIPLKR